MKLDLVADYGCEIGENPLWHPDEGRLYWSDIPTGRMFWYDPAKNRHKQFYQGPPVGGFTIQADGSLLLFGENGMVRVWQNGRVVRTVIEEIPAERGRRFNDVIADPEGRVFCGTMSESARQECALYRLEPDGSYSAVVDNVGISNGMGFSPDLSKLYYTDTSRDTIWMFDYDRSSGTLSNQQVFVDLSRNPIKPDGLTVDERGDVWSAMARGGCVVRFAPDGIEQQRVNFPTTFISCVAFGGPDMLQLYATSGCGNDKANWGKTAGALFRFEPGVRGRPEFRSRIAI